MENPSEFVQIQSPSSKYIASQVCWKSSPSCTTAGFSKVLASASHTAGAAYIGDTRLQDRQEISRTSSPSVSASSILARPDSWSQSQDSTHVLYRLYTFKHIKYIITVYCIIYILIYASVCMFANTEGISWPYFLDSQSCRLIPPTFLKTPQAVASTGNFLNDGHRNSGFTH